MRGARQNGTVLGHETVQVTSQRLGAKSENLVKKEVDMGQGLLAVQLLFYLLSGLGIFFIGVGVLWFVDVYRKKST